MLTNDTNGSSGYVFNIQRYSLHDGLGIRTVVFLKGCPLQCRWCSNPESQRYTPELAYNRSKCIGYEACSRCQTVCEYAAVAKSQDGMMTINRDKCRQCHRCADKCPAKALHTFGRQMSVADILTVVEADSAFYMRSGGGLTISGGEPLVQADFVISILKETKRKRIDATIETCGYAPWADLSRVGAYLKTIIFDIKSMDPNKHKEFTGRNNDLILTNLTGLRRAYPQLQILVRTPLIPGFNDSEQDIGAILDFIKGWPNTSYELLSYHRLGQQKYGYLGRDYPMGDSQLDNGKLQTINAYIKSRTGRGLA
ncbi:(2S)-3-sulfopropanediol dehydratase activating enzyme [Sporomusa termitida]|uniref:4-hydroxyphenylacetate decarboxylase activating enzyme n=1 Tax=Sporomusa termitida TaxID=2377 RepID=A0A517DNT0_9FIRM|nr:glycyl-radical enzyme activating protein [Sporomusa termitida]QDR79023.1 4-hydroxyphenylacetate decarboxylase activating enzyme [Sporomusa termitida]